ncbi:MAG TPA: hypothetical protein VFS05_16415 [Gemmatimonadaceae bacterium]|nr:hypothetical protein [Gemmatimonadaceae bacterium]
MNPDGVSYLDLADAYTRGDWGRAVNAYFSPLYSWLLAAAMWLVPPTMDTEFTIAHVVSFAGYLAALVAFELFLSAFMRAYERAESREGEPAMPRPGWLVAGYSLFIWSALHLNTLILVTPDMWVEAWAYLAAALLVRARLGDTRWLTFASLGLVLGVGYLTKAAMLPIGLAFLVGAALAVRRWSLALPRAALALAAMLLVSAPFIAAISRAKGRLTIGEVSTLAYAWFVNGVAGDEDGGSFMPILHWHGSPPGLGAPEHPTRIVSESPRIYEFAAPVGGTYPPWYDASYWYEGLRVRPAPLQQMQLLVSNGFGYIVALSPIIAVLLVPVWLLGRGAITRASIREYGYLLVPAAAPLAMYASIYTEGRYVAPFVVILVLGTIAVLRLHRAPDPRRLGGAIAGALATVLLVTLYIELRGGLGTAARDLLGRRTVPDVPAAIAHGVRAAGVREGEPVALIGNGLMAYWARLARVRIIAELPRREADRYWAGDDSLKSRVIQTFARTGARAIIAERVPPWAAADGWKAIGETGYVIYPLSTGAPPSP